MSFDSENRVLLTTNSTDSKWQMLIRKVRAMAALPAGFSHGEGLPIEEPAIARAEDLILMASQLELDADVFPNTDGGCAVAFYKDKQRVEVSIHPNGNRFDLRVEHGIGFQFEDVIPPMVSVGLDEVRYRVLKLSRFDEEIWKLYESSISVSLTEQASDFETSSTRTLPNPAGLILQMLEGGSQSSMLLVPA